MTGLPSLPGLLVGGEQADGTRKRTTETPSCWGEMAWDLAPLSKSPRGHPGC